MKQKLALILSIFIIAVTIGCAVPGAAFAASNYNPTRNSFVLDDLARYDENFNIADLSNQFKSRYEVKFLALMEGTDGCLYFYYAMYGTYYQASSIDIATSGSNLQFVNYGLEYIDSGKDYYVSEAKNNFGDTWSIYKYAVYDYESESLYTVENAPVRDYYVSNVYRLYNEYDLDDTPDMAYDSTKDYYDWEVAYTVNLRITFSNSYDDSGSTSPGDSSDTLGYSDVLADLLKDETFDVEDYPEIADDYSLEVLQIAESSDKELFVYVYQHNTDERCTATSINISIEKYDDVEYNPTWRNYKLQFLSHNGTLAKYKVINFVVKDDDVRYYDISSIFRKTDSDIDDVIVGSNTINEVAYEVAKLFVARTVDEEVTYTEMHMDVVTIIDKFCGYIRYSNGFKLYTSSCDSHYVAFSTDYAINTLYEADVEFISQDWHFSRNSIGMGDTWNDPAEAHSKTLKYTDVASSTADGWFAHKYTWDRIEKVTDFVAKENLTNLPEEERATLLTMQWVLRFYESDYENLDYGSNGGLTNWTEVSEVTILRLKFKSNGKIYNLGVVDNKQSEPPGGNSPSNPQQDNDDWWEKFLKRLDAFWDRVEAFFQKIGDFFSKYWIWFAVGAAIIALGILSVFLKPVWTVVKWILKILWWIISAIPRFFVWAGTKISEKVQERKAK